MGSIGTNTGTTNSLDTLKSKFIEARRDRNGEVAREVRAILAERGTTPEQEFQMTVDTLKVGDTAYVTSSNTMGQSYKEVTVTKVTNKQITTSDGKRFMRDTGYLYGEGGKSRGWFTTLETDFQRRLHK